jgi:DNA-binding transcriptional ArsR family regulator
MSKLRLTESQEAVVKQLADQGKNDRWVPQSDVRGRNISRTLESLQDKGVVQLRLDDALRYDARLSSRGWELANGAA